MLCNKLYNDYRATKDVWKVTEDQLILDPKNYHENKNEFEVPKIEILSSHLPPPISSNHNSLSKFDSSRPTLPTTRRTRRSIAEFISVKYLSPSNNNTFHNNAAQTIRKSQPNNKRLMVDDSRDRADSHYRYSWQYNKFQNLADTVKIPRDPHCRRIGLYRQNDRSEPKVVAVKEVDHITPVKRLRQVSSFFFIF